MLSHTRAARVSSIVRLMECLPQMSNKEHSELSRNRRIKEYWQLVSQTAEYRYRICWQGARRVMAERGFDPSRIIQATCDQGDDVNATFILPDGLALSCDFREDSTTRQAVSITGWNPIRVTSTEEDEYSLAAEILRESRLRDAFDRAVSAYFDFHLRQNDRPLLPKAGA
jgi:hypothetical protein